MSELIRLAEVFIFYINLNNFLHYQFLIAILCVMESGFR